jgi:hypothetical protein
VCMCVCVCVCVSFAKLEFWFSDVGLFLLADISVGSHLLAAFHAITLLFSLTAEDASVCTCVVPLCAEVCVHTCVCVQV